LTNFTRPEVPAHIIEKWKSAIAILLNFQILLLGMYQFLLLVQFELTTHTKNSMLIDLNVKECYNTTTLNHN